jgi:hypothetical protein
MEQYLPSSRCSYFSQRMFPDNTVQQIVLLFIEVNEFYRVSSQGYKVPKKFFINFDAGDSLYGNSRKINVTSNQKHLQQASISPRVLPDTTERQPASADIYDLSGNISRSQNRKQTWPCLKSSMLPSLKTLSFRYHVPASVLKIDRCESLTYVRKRTSLYLPTEQV